MRFTGANTAIWIAGFSAVASATAPLAKITPCPDCPSSCAPPLQTVTKQYQVVESCTPRTFCEPKTTTVSSKLATVTNCWADAECTKYDWVSTVIPCNGGESKTTVTKTQQIVTIAHESKVSTETVACPTITEAPHYGYNYNGTHNGTLSTSTSSKICTKLHTEIIDITCPYKEMGPIALPPWEGSGLCDKTCKEDSEGDRYQEVHVKKCLDGKCTDYPETWVSYKPHSESTTVETVYQTSTYCPAAGTYTVPLTTTCTPNAPGYTEPATKTLTITTVVDKPCVIDIVKTITLTYTKPPPAQTEYFTSVYPAVTTTYCSENGVHTIPIVTTCTANNPKYTKPVTTTVYYTTTVTDAPRPVGCTTTITVTYTSTVCPSTIHPTTTTSTTAPATNTATTTKDETTTTVSPTADPSSDPEPSLKRSTEESRDLHMDTGLKNAKIPVRSHKLRRGGLLTSPEKKEAAAVKQIKNKKAKRDAKEFAVKKPFGQ